MPQAFPCTVDVLQWPFIDLLTPFCYASPHALCTMHHALNPEIPKP